MRHHEALETLAYRGYGSESGIVLRSMFEAVVDLMWIYMKKVRLQML